MMATKKPVRTPADLKGKKERMMKDKAMAGKMGKDGAIAIIISAAKPMKKAKKK